MTASAALGMVAALAVTIGVMLLVLQFLRRWSNGIARGHSDLPLEIIQKIPVGPRQGIAMLRAGERVLVVSMVENGIHLLTELEGDDLARALAEPTPSEKRPRILSRRFLRIAGLGLVLACLALPAGAMAQTEGPADQTSTSQSVAESAPQFAVQLGEGEDGLQLSGTVGIVVFMGMMTLVPAMFLLATSFTRIVIVLHFLRTAMGTPTAPPAQLLIVISIVLTGMVMKPVLDSANEVALQPYLRGEITQQEAYKRGLMPFREFMLANTQTNELATFAELTGASELDELEEIPTLTIMSSFITSELKTAFQMGFVIYLPFVVLDLVVAAVLMSMGMFMLPPVMVSLPFKLMLFVLADGWTLVVRNLVLSFNV